METALLTTGLVCVVAAIVGGGFKAFSMEVPQLSSPRRQAALGVVGLLLITTAVLPGRLPKRERGKEAQSGPAAAGNGQALSQVRDRPVSEESSFFELMGMSDAESVHGFKYRAFESAVLDFGDSLSGPQRQLVSKIIPAVNRWVGRGFKIKGGKLLSAAPGELVPLRVDLSAGYKYVFLVYCDENCDRPPVAVFDPDNETLLASGQPYGGIKIVTVVPKRSGVQSLLTKMEKCQADRCDFGVAILIA